MLSKLVFLSKRGFSKTHVVSSRTEELFIGERSSEAVKKYITSHNLNRVLLISSKTLDTKTDEILNIEKTLDTRLVHKITGITEHNPLTDLYNSIEISRKYNIDSILAVGGGSVTDNAKLTSLFVNEKDIKNEKDLIKYRIPGVDKNTGKVMFSPVSVTPDEIPRVILVPTTLSGTTFGAASTNTETGEKIGFGHPLIIPRCMIFDPLITIHTPEWLWLSTGIRALDHCVETIMSNTSNVYWNMLAQNALFNILKYLPKTKSTGENDLKSLESLDARLHCLLSAKMSLESICGGCMMGASHSIGHQLGGLCHVPHGYTSCVMNPCVLKYNTENDPNNENNCLTNETKIRSIFHQINPKIDKGIDSSYLIHHFIESLNMPRTLSEVFVTEDMFDELAELSLNAPWTKSNPVPITKKEQIIEILNIANNAKSFEFLYK